MRPVSDPMSPTQMQTGSTTRCVMAAILLGVSAIPLAAPAFAKDIEPYHARTITPYHARTITPYRAQTVQPAPSRATVPTQGRQAGPASPRGGIHVFTQQERDAMSRNDRQAGRTHDSVRGGGSGAPGALPSCAPNCGYDYSTGRSAPTIYNPNYNYSGAGR
jgi:hypothetical protein